MIYPIFVCPGEKVRTEVSSMPGQYNLSIDNAVQVAREAEKAGVAGILLFGIPSEKDEVGSDCYLRHVCCNFVNCASKMIIANQK